MIKKRYEENKNSILEKNKIWRDGHKEEIRKRKQSRYQILKKEMSRKSVMYHAKRRAIDPVYRLRMNVSKAVFKMLKSNSSSKNGQSILKFLPYSPEELKLHLESLFESWMTWENRGKYSVKNWDDNDSSTWTWQLDHIIPHSTFHYETMDCEEFRKAWALTNLRPFSAKQNIMDGVNRTRHLKK